jgi:MFS family permease
MIADIASEDRMAQSYGLLYIATNVGFSLGPALGGFIAVIGYHYLFGAAFGTELVVFAIFVLLLRETYIRKKTDSMGSTLRGMGKVIYDRAFMLYCFGVALSGSVYSLFFSVFPVYINNYVGINEIGIGFIWMLNATMVLVLQMPIARFIEKRNRGKTIFSGMLFYAVGFAAIGIAGEYAILLLLIAIITVGENIITPAMSALVAEIAPEDMRGRYMAFNGIAWSVGFGVGPLVGGLLLDVALDLLWPIAGLTCVVSAIAFLGLRNVMVNRQS